MGTRRKEKNKITDPHFDVVVYPSPGDLAELLFCASTQRAMVTVIFRFEKFSRDCHNCV